MIRFLLAFALSGAVAHSCAAGAWMREEGQGFLSLGVHAYEQSGSGTEKVEQTLFIEYGLRPWLTIGAQVNFTAGEEGDGRVFLRLPLRDDDRPSRLAVELGIGAESTDGVAFDPLLRTGLSWGRGLLVGGRPGWINVDGAVQWGADDPPLFKIDATLGLTLSERFQVMGQTFFDADEFGQSVTVVPSVIYKPKSFDMRFVVGFEHKSGRDERTGIRFGIWRDF